MLNDNLNGDEIQAMKDQIRDLLLRNFLESASVTIGRVRIGGTAILLIDSNGGLVINGKLTGDGTLTWTGPVNLKGLTNITGNTTIDGLTTLLKRLTITAPGDIRVGGAIPMTIGNAIVAFDSGGSVIGYTGGVRIASGGTPDIVVSTGGVSITGGSGPYLTVSGGGHLLGQHKTTTLAANVYIDSTTGLLSRTTSAARFKIDPQAMDLPDALLDVPVKDWIDLGNAERFAAVYAKPRPYTKAQQLDFDSATLARVPGIIAEEVEAAGGAAFVTYDEDGQINGVAYDRLALARTEITARKLDAAMELITELQRRLSDIEAGQATGT